MSEKSGGPAFPGSEWMERIKQRSSEYAALYWGEDTDDNPVLITIRARDIHEAYQRITVLEEFVVAIEKASGDTDPRDMLYRLGEAATKLLKEVR